MSRPIERPTSTQLEEMRKATHKAVDRILDAWPKMHRRMREYERGFPQALGSIGSGIGDPTGESAIRDEADPNIELREWLGAQRELLKFLFSVDDWQAALLSRLSREAGRRNSVDVCFECKNPALTVKRVDGEPFCLACYDRRRVRA